MILMKGLFERPYRHAGTTQVSTLQHIYFLCRAVIDEHIQRRVSVYFEHKPSS